MAFLSKRFSKLTGKWTVAAKNLSSYDTKRLAKDIEKESTVSYADVTAVLAALPNVMTRYMAEGHTVKLGGIGTFYLAVQCTKTGVDSPDKVSADQITNVKVQFRPEMTSVGRKAKRTNTLVAEDLEWHFLASDDKDDSGNPTSGGLEPTEPSLPGEPNEGGNTGGNQGGGTGIGE